MRDNWLNDELNEMFQDYDSEMNLEAEWSALQEKREAPQRPSRLWLLCTSIVVIGTSLYLYTASQQQNHRSESSLAEMTNLTDYQSDSASTYHIDKENNNTIEVKKNERETEQTTDQSAQYITEESPALLTKSKISNNNSTSIPRVTQIEDPFKNTYSNSESITSNFLAQASTPNNSLTNQKSEEAKSVVANLSIDRIQEVGLLTSLIDQSPNQVDISNLAEIQSRVRKKANKAGAYAIGLELGYSPITQGGIFADETTVDGMSSSLYFKKYLTSHFYLKTGINLDRYTTQVTGTSVNSYTEIQDNQILERYYEPDGTFIPVFGEAPVAIDEVTDYELFNRYQFVSVPVIVGIQLLERNNSFLELEGGLSATIATQSDAKFFDGTSQFVEYDDLTIRTQGLLSGIGGISWHYQPQSMQKLNLFCKLGARVQLNDTTIEVLNTADKFQSYSVGVGAEYRL